MDAQGRVVVGLDGSVGSREAALVAARSARRRGARLAAVVAVDATPRITGRIQAAAAGVPHAPVSETGEHTYRMARGMLDDVLHQVRREEGTGPETDVVAVPGHPVEVLLDAAGGAEELVVGHRGRGAVASALLGSVGMSTVRHATCPVTVVPPHGVATGPVPVGVVVGLDASDASRAALDHALREAVRRGTSVTAVVAYPDEDAAWPQVADLPPWPQDVARMEVTRAREVVAATVAAARADGEAVPPVEVVGGAGSPAAVLTEASRDAELLVVGHRGHGSAHNPLRGSTGLGCVLHAACPVTVVPTGPDSPARAEHPSEAPGVR